jgi:hypothetical protein
LNDEGIFHVGQRKDPVAQALATLAIGEVNALASTPTLREAVERAASAILRFQQKEGGWYHDFQTFDRHSRYSRRDTLVSAIQLQALHGAWWAGLAVTGLEDAVRRGLEDLLSVQDPQSGQFGAESRGVGPLGHTGAALWALQAYGLGRGDPALAALRALDEGLDPTRSSGKWTLMDTWLTMQAVFNQGGDLWTAWKSRVTGELVARQDADGFWTVPPVEKRMGVPCATALSLLILQTPYRLSPATTWFPDQPHPPRWRLKREGVSHLVLGSIPVTAAGRFLSAAGETDPSAYNRLVIPVADRRAFFRQLGNASVLPDGETLEDRLSPESWSQVSARLKKWGVAEADVAALRPWALAMGCWGAAQESLGITPDSQLAARLVEETRGKMESTGLLTAEEVAGWLNEASAEEVETVLAASMRAGADAADLYGEMLDAWRGGNPQDLEAWLAARRESEPEAADVLDKLVERANQAMLPRLLASLEQDPCLVVLDVWNVLGPRGMLGLLREQGYEVEQD